MQSCQSKYFGVLVYEASAVIEFPEGLPGFEDQRRFILIDRQDLTPLVFMQSLDTPGLCFLAVPAGVVTDNYLLELPDDSPGFAVQVCITRDPRTVTVGPSNRFAISKPFNSRQEINERLHIVERCVHYPLYIGSVY